jgi:hypothetical protein
VNIGPAPACFKCAHYRGTGELGPLCAAFPFGVPDDIYYGGFDHRQAFPGDGGIRWEPAAGVEAERSPT